MAPVTVDLTQDDTLSEDDLVIVAAGPAPRRSEPSSPWNPTAHRASTHTSFGVPPRATQGGAGWLGSLSAASSGNKPSAQLDNAQETPTKAAKISSIAQLLERSPVQQPQFQAQVQTQPQLPPILDRTAQPYSLPPQTYFHPPKSLNQAQDPLQSPAPQTSHHQPLQQHTPKTQTPRKMDWSVDKIALTLTSFVEDVERDHTRLVEYLLEDTESKAPGKRHLSPVDHFAGMKSLSLDPGVPLPEGTKTMAVKFKQHSESGKSKGSGKKSTFPVIPLKSIKEEVPGYRFHHVEIRKNILAAHSQLNFVPHLRDVDPNSAEERQYSMWLTELDKMDTQSGFKTQDKTQKYHKRKRNEQAARLSSYLDRWLQKLEIDGCTKSALIRYMALQLGDANDAVTPQQKSSAITPSQRTSILNSYRQDAESPHASKGASMFTEAFDKIFDDPSKSPRVTLQDVLLLDKKLKATIDNKRTKDTPSVSRYKNTELVPGVESHLASYSILGCLICFSYDCEHGDFDNDNNKGAFSLDSVGGIPWTLKTKWKAQRQAQKDNENADTKGVHHQPCRNDCYRNYDVGNPAHPVKEWAENEIWVLKSTFATIGYSTTLKAYCFVAAVLGRKCWDVYRKFKELDLKLPEVELRDESLKVKPVPWYDRKKKQLIGDWQDYTVTHEHSLREITDPCHHDGPCTAANGCPCASARPRAILCDRLCSCTVEECAIKFTGCACHSSGKTCLQRQKEGKPCICVQLNRECDPVLCQGCGANKRADPEYAQDDHLHSTGCQNVSLQRGSNKVLLLGRSQLEGCGYGLYTAEDIAQDEFVIEYTGELITHDEGVRREARRGDVFDEKPPASYLFTLLDLEGTWVDAAMYGNLSRYINHADERDKRGQNIMPKIMYVNHEFRIKFVAMRDIKAGEELFFNYGENFPNLTKKLLEENEDQPSQGAQGKRKVTGKRDTTARKGTTQRGKKKALDEFDEDDDPTDWKAGIPDDEDDQVEWAEHSARKRKKRGGRRPGAGRKKKLVPGESYAGTEISDSQSTSPPGALDTPSRRRQTKQANGGSGSDFGVTIKQSPSQPPKKTSKRGGARPGAGRKPKHPKPSTSITTSKEGGGENGITAGNDGKGSPSTDSDDVPLMATARAGRQRGLERNPPSGAGETATAATATARKRKAGEMDTQSPASVAASGTVNGAGGSAYPYRQDHFQLVDDDDDDDDDDVVDRQARKRQKPLRYRVEDA
ncbi:hypothetical protein OQA88_1573 [Cercophora sp. LCS_1]